MANKNRHCPTVASLLVAWLITALSPATSTANPAQQTSRTFPETGKTVSGKFLTYWNAHGGLPQQGYPISDEMREKSDTDGKLYNVQYFERAVFELHPENQPPFDVLLSLLGNAAYATNYPGGRSSGLVPQRPGTVKRSQCSATHDDSDSGPASGAGFSPEAPLRQVVGKGHIVTGMVLSAADCSPIAGVKVETRPEIGGAHPDDQRATLYTDATGSYRFESLFPEHIHMRITAHGFRQILDNGYHTSPGQTAGTHDIVLVPDPSCRLFPTTGQSLCGTFLQYWLDHGDLAQQGYPVSDEFQEKSPLDGHTYTVQYFERSVFELHPENQPPYNVLLSQLGTLRYKAHDRR